MFKKLYQFAFLGIFGLNSYVLAQDAIFTGKHAADLIPKAIEVHLRDQTASPVFIEFQQGNGISSANFFETYSKAINLGSDDQFIIKSSETDQLGFLQSRYQQYYKGIKVEGGEYILEEKEGSIKEVNGCFFPGLNISISAAISPDLALNAAKQSIAAKSYKWELPSEEQFIKSFEKNENATYNPLASAELVIAPIAGNYNSPVFRLVYKLDVYAQEPLSRNYVYVDAISGQVINSMSRIHVANASGTANTKYNGSQTIIADSYSGAYRLRTGVSLSTGRKLETYDMNNGTNYSAAVDFTDADNNWTADPAAYSAHFGAEATYDYFNSTYSRNSFNNAGAAIKSYVHYDNNYVNAFWDGSKMTYGDGDGTNYSELTSLDVVGHEISHAVTQYTSNLAYQNESGALNESFSDIFGTAIEFYKEGTSGDWKIGEDFDLGSGAGFRSMSNPNAHSQPDTYTGTYYQSNSIFPNLADDYGGVHTNSGVQNFWFYLLAQGGTGTNDKGNAYSVSGIGITKAAAIAFRNNTVKLTSSATHANARTGAIAAAKELYGVSSQEEASVTNAWYAVGVGAAYSGPAPTCAVPASLSTTSVTSSSATLNWGVASGNISYNVRYKTTAGSIWTTTTSTTTSKAISGLTASTTYEFQVQNVCTGTSTSAYSASTNFTTTATPTCNVPASLSATSVGASSATLNWGAASGAISYNVQYKTTASSTWTSTTSTTTSKAISGLTAGTAYEFKVQSVCSGSTTSAFSAATNFTTGYCDVPSGLNATSINTVSCTLNWTAVSGAASYNIQYKATASSTWTSTTSTTTSKAISGLTASTAYEFKVQTACTNSYNSSFSATTSFTTTSGPVTYCTAKGTSTASEWIKQVQIGSINNNTAANGGYADFTSISTDLTAGDTISITLTPGFNPGILAPITGPNSSPEYWRLYVDFNHDGDFTDVGELAYDAGAISKLAVSGNLIIPSDATLGNTRMRVMMKYNAASTSCETFPYGEVEDYTTNIISSGGSFTASTVDTGLVANNKKYINYTIYPNPTNESVTISINSEEDIHYLEARIFDITGKQVHVKEFGSIDKGNTNLTVLMEQLPAGVYSMMLQSDSFNKVQKIVLIK